MCRWALVRKLGIPLQPSVVEAFSTRYQQLPGHSRYHPSRMISGKHCPNRRLHFRRTGLDELSAKKCAALNYLEDFLPVANLALLTGEDLLTMAELLSRVKQQLGLPAIIESLAQVQSLERWDRLAWQSLHSKFGSLGFEVALAVWRETRGDCQRYLSMRSSRLRVLRDQQARLQGRLYLPIIILLLS